MDLGAFTVSLAVKDIEKSMIFYSKLGFEKIGGDIGQKWLILKSGNAVVGLFQGMFEKNILTFIPGWDQNGKETAEYTDIREIQRALKNAGILLNTEADESSSGPASFTLEDPDGNQMLFDQYR